MRTESIRRVSSAIGASGWDLRETLVGLLLNGAQL